jgi:hypothetical protein
LGISLDDIGEFLSLSQKYPSGNERYRYALPRIDARIAELFRMGEEINKTIEELPSLKSSMLARWEAKE